MTHEELWDEESEVGWDKEPDVDACGEVDACRNIACPNISVMIYHKHKFGDPEAVLPEKRLAHGMVEVDVEDIEAVSWKSDNMLHEVCVAAMRDEGR